MAWTSLKGFERLTVDATLATATCFPSRDGAAVPRGTEKFGASFASKELLWELQHCEEGTSDECILPSQSKSCFSVPK